MEKFEQSYKKPEVAKIRSGDTVRVHQRISEGNKQRTQVFEGVVIRTTRQKSHTAGVTVRRIASGVGVEKTFMMHSPTVEKIEVLRRSQVRRNYLTYMRQRQGKSARLREVGFDRAAAEVSEIPEISNEEPEEEKQKETAKPEAKPKSENAAKTEKETGKKEADHKKNEDSE